MQVRKAGLLVVAGSFMISAPLLAEPTKTEAVITKVEGHNIIARTVNVHSP